MGERKLNEINPREHFMSGGVVFVIQEDTGIKVMLQRLSDGTVRSVVLSDDGIPPEEFNKKVSDMGGLMEIIKESLSQKRRCFKEI